MFDRTIASSVVLACLAIGAGPAFAQAHEVTDGVYTLRSSTVSSRAIPASVAKAHGFVPERGLAILNATVLRKHGKSRESVPANVTATVKSSTGVTREVKLSAARENGSISYFGTYRHVTGDALSLTITARAEDARAPLTLRYRDRL